jgi:hypothetical protein
MMNVVPRRVPRETVNVNDELLAMSESSGIASTLDEPAPARMTLRELATAHVGGKADLKPYPEQTRKGSAA